jgi:hypothetical protein
LELEMRIERLPAGFDSATVQLLVAPAAIFNGMQVSDDSFGVDHSCTVAACVEAPRVAPTAAWAFAGIVPAVAVALPVALPDGTVSVAGIESRTELELSETAVFAETVSDSVTRQVVVAPDIKPVALQATPETSTGARRLTAVF